MDRKAVSMRLLTIRLCCAAFFVSGCSTTEQEVETLIEQLAANEIESPAWNRAVDQLIEIGRPAARQLIAHVPAAFYVGGHYREHRREIEKIRVGCARALGHIKPRAASAPLVATATEAFSNAERLAGIWAVGEIGFEQATVTALLKELDKTIETSLGGLEPKDPTIRLRTVVALAKMGEEDSEGEIGAALASSNPALKEAALSELAGAGHFGVPILVELAKRETSDKAKLLAILDQVKQRLRVQLNDEDPVVRADAARGLGWIGDVDVRGLLVERLGDPSNQVRFNAATSLSEMGISEGIEFLFDALESVDPILRANAVKFLVEVQRNSDVVEERLLATLSHENALARSGSAEVLGQAKVESAIEALLGTTRDADANVRCNAIIALGVIHSASSRSRLTELLDDPNETVAYYAAWALSELDRYN